MKNRLKYVLIPALTLLIAVSCTEEWDNHYDEGSFDLPGYSIMGYIDSQPELSAFKEMLHQTGYDSILSASQSFTVWAPVNSGLSGVDMNNAELVYQIVRNHITRGVVTTSGIDAKSIQALNGKNVVFANERGAINFGKINLSQPNIRTSNGLVHVIDGYVPYLYNIWEYIEAGNNLDSLENYLYSQNTLVFDPANSVELGVNSEGQPVYDSVFIASNPILERIGSLNNEDSAYTVILPNNTAWTEAYNRIENYFNIPEIYGGVARQKELTEFTIVQDIVFRDFITDPASLDSVVSTNNNVFYNPAEIFSGAAQREHSNGLSYVADRAPYADTASWFKEIRVEAEASEGREETNSNIFPRSGLGTGFAISNDSYILVDPTGTSNIARPGITFSIPNTLSAKYRIYCVFVPPAITNPAGALPSKVEFRLLYLRTTTGRTRRMTIVPDNNIVDANSITKMFITEFDFEFANIIDEDNEEVSVTLQVYNDVDIEETSEFTRQMRIDYVVLEPVLE